MSEKIYDVVILGAGPAGLSAAIYAARSKLSVLIVEKGIDGGQIALSHKIENYPGQSEIEGMSGQELIAPMTAQTYKFGVERAMDTIHACDLTSPIKTLTGSAGEYRAKSVIICTGAMTRFIGCKNEAKYVGRGVSYCAVCDARFFQGLDIYVTGGNNIAAEEALYLAKFAKKLVILHTGEKLSVSAPMLEQLEAQENLEVRLNTKVEELGGDFLLDTIIVSDTKTGEKSEIKAEPADGCLGLFGFTGKKTTGIFEGIIELENGYIKTNELMQTNIPGVYAAGDVRVTPLRQVVTACSDGAIAAMQCVKYVPTVK